jgi:nitric oxide reductase subunit C
MARSTVDPSPVQGTSPMWRRGVYFTLILLFLGQTAVTYTSATEARRGSAVFNARAVHGQQLYREFNCTACHQFYGLGGYMGPDLTNVLRAENKGAEYAKGIILHGTQRMPSMGLTPEQADDLIAYLVAASASGSYPIRSVDPTPWGTYRQMHEDDE